MESPYREPAPLPPDPFVVAWAKLRRRRRTLRLSVLMVFALLVPGLMPALIVNGPPAMAVALGLALAVPATLLVLSRLPAFRCPCCDAPFFTSVAVELGGASSCASCGIVAGTPSDGMPAARTGHGSTRGSSTRHGSTRHGSARDDSARRASSTRHASTGDPIHPARSLGLASVAAFVGYWLGELSSRGLAVAMTVSVAAFVTTFAAAAMRNRTFPRAWLVPIAALFFASLVGAGTMRARRSLLEMEARRRGPPGSDLIARP